MEVPPKCYKNIAIYLPSLQWMVLVWCPLCQRVMILPSPLSHWVLRTPCYLMVGSVAACEAWFSTVFVSISMMLLTLRNFATPPLPMAPP